MTSGIPSVVTVVGKLVGVPVVVWDYQLVTTVGAAPRRQSSGSLTKTSLFPLSLKPIWRRGDLFGLPYLCRPVRNHIAKLVYPVCPLDSRGGFKKHKFPHAYVSTNVSKSIKKPLHPQEECI